MSTKTTRRRKPRFGRLMLVTVLSILLAIFAFVATGVGITRVMISDSVVNSQTLPDFKWEAKDSIYESAIEERNALINSDNALISFCAQLNSAVLAIITIGAFCVAITGFIVVGTIWMDVIKRNVRKKQA